MRKSIVSIIIAAFGTILFTIFLITKLFTPGVYLLSLTLLGFICLTLFGFERILKIDFKKWIVTLAEMKSVREDIYATRKEFEKTVISTAELIAILHTFTGIMGDADSAKYRDIILRKKTDQLLNHLEIVPDIRKDIFKYKDMINQLQSTKGEERKTLWKAFIKTLEDDSKLL